MFCSVLILILKLTPFSHEVLLPQRDIEIYWLAVWTSKPPGVIYREPMVICLRDSGTLPYMLLLFLSNLSHVSQDYLRLYLEHPQRRDYRLYYLLCFFCQQNYFASKSVTTHTLVFAL